jgi:hypothetical protein
MLEKNFSTLIQLSEIDINKNLKQQIFGRFKVIALFFKAFSGIGDSGLSD